MVYKKLMGRPLQGDKPLDQRMLIHLDSDTKGAICLLADKYNVSKSRIVRQAIHDYITDILEVNNDH